MITILRMFILIRSSLCKINNFIFVVKKNMREFGHSSHPIFKSFYASLCCVHGGWGILYDFFIFCLFEKKNTKVLCYIFMKSAL